MVPLQKVPQTDSENAPADKKCPKRIPKMVPLRKSAPNGFRKCPRCKKCPNGFRLSSRYLIKPNNNAAALLTAPIGLRCIVVELFFLRFASAALQPCCFFSNRAPLHCCRAVSSPICLRCIAARVFLLELNSAALLPNCFSQNQPPLHCCRDNLTNKNKKTDHSKCRLGWNRNADE
jgi:hypothetical protein